MQELSLYAITGFAVAVVCSLLSSRENLELLLCLAGPFSLPALCTSRLGSLFALWMVNVFLILK